MERNEGGQFRQSMFLPISNRLKFRFHIAGERYIRTEVYKVYVSASLFYIGTTIVDRSTFLIYAIMTQKN